MVKTSKLAFTAAAIGAIAAGVVAAALVNRLSMARAAAHARRRGAGQMLPVVSPETGTHAGQLHQDSPEVVMPAPKKPNSNTVQPHPSSAASKRSSQRAGHRQAKTASGKTINNIRSRHAGGKDPHGPTKEQLYHEARKRNIRGRSTMTKAELQRALS